MNKFQTKRVARSIEFDWEYIAEKRLRPSPVDFEDAADTQRLKAALKRAVAKPDAPAYLIDAIRRGIRK
jgi:hypothetical protein